MRHRSLKAAIDDLASAGQLVRIEEEIDPYLEAAEVQRRVYAAGGPAVYFARVKGCRFPMVGNLFGTLDRARYLFRDTLSAVGKLVALKVDPAEAAKHPLTYAGALKTVWHTRPKFFGSGEVLRHQTQIDQLPQVKSWPQDGGAFITLPQVYTEDATRLGWQ